jgi:hypothetical protein
MWCWGASPLAPPRALYDQMDMLLTIPMREGFAH